MHKSLKHLSFQSLRHYLSNTFRSLPDKRQQSKVKYPIHDVVMSGFAMMYFQDPSLLQFQKRLREENGMDNLKTLFEVEDVPEDTQMRDILDELDREEFRPIYKEYLHRLQRGKHLERYHLFDGSIFCAVDGTNYFSSDEVNCSSCLLKEHRKGKVSYSHSILQGAIMHPSMRQVFPLMPEEIRNSDGQKKQDCEINAGKRFIQQLRKDHPRMQITLGGDGLNSKQPFIEAARAEKMNFIFVAKPGDHKALFDWIEVAKKQEEVKQFKRTDEKGRIHVYEWMNQVPLNGSEETIWTNYFSYELQVLDEKTGEFKVNYRNSWVTDFKITKDRVEELTNAGRCRWKVENECFNVLKNQGYSITHNYGHGKKNLSFNFLQLILLSFFFHQIAELTDSLFQACREKHGSKAHMWETLRTAIKWFVFETWEILFEFILNSKAFDYKPFGVMRPKPG